ncbi:delta-class carbonic anhydrase [Marinomonas sp. THO17]|uniref:delta-class carbonic anhydrase n=1 Tax=Marinomonas sp. THO17 TaxID=3149048 RepID=UPI00336BF601
MKVTNLMSIVGISLFTSCVFASESNVVSDEVISEQRSKLAESSYGKGYGPQAPRDIERKFGRNILTFGEAPVVTKMNLCNIHFHKNAEHKGGEFTTYAGNGDGEGYQTGYLYNGKLTAQELRPIKGGSVCKSKHSKVSPGDTIEVHYVYSSAQVKPGPTLGSCISEEIKNPQLRVEAQVYVVVNDDNALDFGKLTAYGERNGFYQATDIPSNTGKPISYAGSTTGPGYNEKASPYQVTWNVRPKVQKVSISTVGDWCDSDNVFKEDHAHGVRNLVTNPDLLSNMSH